MIDAMPVRDLVAALDRPLGLEALLERDPPLVVVDLDDDGTGGVARAREVLAALPIVVVGRGAGASAAADLVDVVVDRDDDASLARIAENAGRVPLAATALAVLLRGAENRSINEGLAAESSVYSMLQAGPEFASWRASCPPRVRPGREHAVVVRRDDDVLHVTLSRPEVHNALNTQMRDELYEALLVAAADPKLSVVLDGEGASFCAGGDLDEFGARSDPASAHHIRLRRSIGRVIASMAGRVTATVHGACMGSGIELPAFAGRVVARPDARFGLPELGLGLIPGAGGTVSLTRRIGRHRTGYLAFGGIEIDAPTALSWGLVDAVVT